jgi:hypothetical protein
LQAGVQGDQHRLEATEPGKFIKKKKLNELRHFPRRRLIGFRG